MRILLIEDDQATARMVERWLNAHGHRVLTAESGEDGVLLARTEAPDLVLLDIVLPGQDGHQVLAGIRSIKSRVPVIILSGRGDLDSKVSALNGGADDYVTKPFALEELLARINSVTRRADRLPAWIECGDLRLDVLSRHVWRDGRRVELSRREFALLEYFVRNQGRLLSRHEIRSAIWEEDFHGGSNVVDVYVRYLRAKLDPPDQPSLIVTVRGGGYRFDSPAPPAGVNQPVAELHG